MEVGSVLLSLAILVLGAVLGFRANLLAGLLAAAYIVFWYVTVEPWIQGLGTNTESLVAMLLVVPIALLALLAVLAWWLAAGIIVGVSLKYLTGGPHRLLGDPGGGR